MCAKCFEFATDSFDFIFPSLKHSKFEILLLLIKIKQLHWTNLKVSNRKNARKLIKNHRFKEISNDWFNNLPV